MRLSLETVSKLQQDTSNIRNICILAHVDHGKTSLSDSLLATNGIISQRMAGKVRYLDSREDEQLRGITMEASAISLYFRVMKRKENSEEVETKEHLVNLIDSPGHIDFSLEVSTSSRLCDGAVVLVDVVEGVCSQTVNVLRQCWVDNLKPLLVLNKIDRLISEWQLTPLEAYQHLKNLIEQVNSVLGSFFAGERMQDDLEWRESGANTEFIERDDENIYFSPDKNNVIFSLAIDGWAFTVNLFARIYLNKLGFLQQALAKSLWGDFYLKNKRIVPGNNGKPLFVSLILEQIWSVYDACLTNREKLEKIITTIGAKLSPRDLRAKDHKQVVNLVMSQWIPLSHALLGAVIDYLPSPSEGQQTRSKKLIGESGLLDAKVEQAFQDCDSKNPYTLAYVSKMISVPDDHLPKDGPQQELSVDELRERGRIARELAKKASEEREKQEAVAPKKDPFEWEFEEEDFEEEEEEQEEEFHETLIGVVRIFSGKLEKGQKVTIVGPKYDQNDVSQLTHEVEIADLYLIMGREFVKMDSIPAGNICGVVGLEGAVLKNATICSSEPYPNLASTSLIHNKPIMKIAVEPTNPLKLAKLERGFELLSSADPVLEWYIDDDSGELIMCVAGELHLERCLKDLEDRFAKGCTVTVKEPVIPFREGLADTKVHSNAPVEDLVAPAGIELEFDVAPLPQEVVLCLIENEDAILQADSAFESRLLKVFEEAEFTGGFSTSEELVKSIILFGPKRIGPNIFVESTESGQQMRRAFGSNDTKKFEHEVNVLSGFQLAMNEGPLSHEPVQGVLVTLKTAKKEEHEDDDRVVNLDGRVITFTRQLIHKAFLTNAPRLFLAMYTCDIQASAEVLGKVYAVVQKRGGMIVSEEMKEGTPFFTIEAEVPVIEAFGFSEDIRKKTSGAALPQLFFAGFKMLDIDPFWVPNTELELEELGEFAERENVARKYMNNIRRRKGLFVDEKVVKNAEKQRTLKKD